MDVYAKPSGGNGSHLDMLHESPYSMGIEWDKGNAFWVYDGHNKDICWYDFVDDHGPGNSYHSDGKVHRYPDLAIKRKSGVASHMVLDHETGWLYIVDPGNARVLKMNTTTGTKRRDITRSMEALAENWEMTGVDWKIFTNSNLEEPCGIELSNGVLYVTDHATGEIIAYGVDTGYELGRFDTGLIGIMGIKADKEGKLWFVCTDSDEVYKIEPQ
jgi:outer membrane protein assembly factor BamB